MTFIDLLTSQLFVLGFIGLLVASITIREMLLYKSGRKHHSNFKAGALPLTVLGIYAFVTGLYGQLTWPLPGSYNILFYDVYTLMGLLFISLAWTMRSDLDTQHVGFFGLLIGLVTIYYGIVGYNIGLTTVPIALLGLYSLFGLAGVLSYPMTIMFDRATSGVRNRSVWWVVLVVAFLIAIIFGSLLAVFVAASAIPAHLLTTP